MNEPLTPAAMIVGTPGVLKDELLHEAAGLGLGHSGFLFCLLGADTETGIESMVATAADRPEALRHLCLLTASASTAAHVVEDALRYLAAQVGVPFALLRVSHEAFTREEAARAAAQRAISLARGGGRKRRDPAPIDDSCVVLVTGAAGQIGRAMGHLLDEHGIRRRGIDIVHAQDSSPLLKHDLGDPAGVERLREFCAPVTHVIHLASRITNAKSLADSYPEQFRLNVAGTLNLLKALPTTFRHFSYASSMTVYGNNQLSPVDETRPVEPNCVYALCKLASERYLAEFGERTGARIALLRYTSAYGPGPSSGRAIPRMICRALEGQAPEIYGEGAACRDYIYLDDLCRATLRASVREADGIFNIGTGVGITAAELADMIARLSGGRVKPVRVPQALDAQAVSSLVYDVSKMRRELGFTPLVTMEEGLLKTITHFQASKRPALAA